MVQELHCTRGNLVPIPRPKEGLPDLGRPNTKITAEAHWMIR